MAIAGLLLAPAWAMMEGDLRAKAYEQEFIITAYYSPVDDQCCYVKGGEQADKILNGEGRTGADGTMVYPGMAAAPASYAFGTRIALPGIGIVTVHDRGGAIVEQGSKHRLDLWVGYGEEGLARALAFGVRRVRGTIYPLGSSQPAERLVLDHLESPFERLEPFLTLDYGLLDARSHAGMKGLSVTMLQETLRDLGYFDHAITGSFGAVTQEGLTRFLRAMGTNESGVALSERGAAMLVAARKLQRDASAVPLVQAGSSMGDVSAAQRLLRLIGLYHGRTDGRYDDDVRQVIFRFQNEQGLVGAPDGPGAGRIGPLTRGRLLTQWMQRLVMQRTNRLLSFNKVRATLERRGATLTRFLELGETGDSVRTYQEMLAQRELFPREKINGVFGPLTQEATIRYQLAGGLIKRASDPGAGTVGSQTLRNLRREQAKEAYELVHGYGWKAL